jgi:hypothetical protein
MNRSSSERSIDPRLTCDEVGGKKLPRRVRALAAGAEVNARIDPNGRGIVLPVTVPAGQVETALLTW